MNVIVGIIVVLGSVIGGFLMAGGQIMALIHPNEVVVIGGAALGAFLISNPAKVSIAALKAIPTLFGGSKYGKPLYMDLLALMYDLFSKSRKDGLMAVEADIEEPANSEIFKKYPKIMKDHHVIDFISDYMRMIIGGSMNAFELEALMDSDLETHHHHAAEPSHALTRVADGLPGFGIVAAVLGVVITMSHIGGPPAELGAHIGAALVGTFLGILAAYGFVGPMAILLEHRAGGERQFFACIKTCLMASVQGYSPQVAVEFGRKSMPLEFRPSFQELEEHVKGKKA